MRRKREKRVSSEEKAIDKTTLFTLAGVILLSLGIFLVGRFHSVFGTASIVIGSSIIYVTIIYLVFKL